MNIMDRGVPSLLSSANVTFRITDVNEMRPSFSESSYSAMVLSTAPAGTSLIRVFATDDDGQDNMISYSIINRAENNATFTVDSAGVIRNDGSLENSPGVSHAHTCTYSAR